MGKFEVGDRVRIVDTAGYILSKKQQTGTVVNRYGLSFYSIDIDNYGGSPLSFRAEWLAPMGHKYRVRLLGIPLFTIEKEAH